MIYSIQIIKKSFKTCLFNEIYECFKNKEEYPFIPVLYKTVNILHPNHEKHNLNNYIKALKTILNKEFNIKYKNYIYNKSSFIKLDVVFRNYYIIDDIEYFIKNTFF